MDALDVLPWALMDVVDNFDEPVIMRVTDRLVPVTRDFVGEVRYGRRHFVRMQPSPCGDVLQPEEVVILDETESAIRANCGRVPWWDYHEVVVVVFIVVARYLLLVRP
jgi:hypothetical protein